MSALAKIGRSWLGRNIGLILTVAAILSALTTYIVITGSDAALGLKPKRVINLLILNITILTLLIGVVSVRVYGLWSALRKGSAGSKLQGRILLLFAVVTISPTLVVSIFSTLFFNMGIQAWFNDKVQMAVNESLAVAEAYLTEHKENIRGDALAMAGDLNNVAGLALSDPPEFSRIVAAQSAMRLLTESIVIYKGRIIAQGRLSFSLSFERIPQENLDRANSGEVIITTTDDDKVRALVRLSALPDAYLVVGRLVDSRVINHMQNAQGAVSEYQTLKDRLDKLQFIFSIVFLTLALLLLLAAIWYGMVFAAKLTTPISNLMLMAERVRSGDFSARIAEDGGKDEMGNLVRTFNRMSEQLEAQRGELISANRLLDERRRFSEAVLSGVSAGIIALNFDKEITLINRSSNNIFAKIERTVEVSTPIAEVIPGINELLLQAEALQGDVAQSSITIANAGKSITLHVRVTAEKQGSELKGFIVTFDDITLLISAQRNAAWADVARRVAHEIKNPLTPIQLSAERLKKKYFKFITEDAENFTKYIDTISKNVGDIGRMVEEFVAFARMPTPRFVPEDLGSIIKKSVFSSHVAFPNIDIQFERPELPVMFECDERQITQVMTNLVKNAAESIEARLYDPQKSQEPGIIILALHSDEENITLSVSDNGLGFASENPEDMLKPYVTTSAKGMGLGLDIVKKIVEDHKGLIKVENNADCGAKVTLSFPPHCDIKDAS